MVPGPLEIGARNDPDNTVTSDSWIVDLDIACRGEPRSNHEVAISRAGFWTSFQLGVRNGNRDCISGSNPTLQVRDAGQSAHAGREARMMAGVGDVETPVSSARPPGVMNATCDLGDILQEFRALELFGPTGKDHAQAGGAAPGLDALREICLGAYGKGKERSPGLGEWLGFGFRSRVSQQADTEA